MSSFLDTNVVVYAFDTADRRKQRIATAILESDDRLVISTQVLLETWWTLTRKIADPLSNDQASEVIEQLCVLPVVQTDCELATRAIRTSVTARAAVWDALIVEAARSAGCQQLLSEDLQHGQRFGGLLVEDPFRADRQT